MCTHESVECTEKRDDLVFLLFTFLKLCHFEGFRKPGLGNNSFCSFLCSSFHISTQDRSGKKKFNNTQDKELEDQSSVARAV
jgi:hypothetical protein